MQCKAEKIQMLGINMKMKSNAHKYLRLHEQKSKEISILLYRKLMKERSWKLSKVLKKAN